jgi:hypothetical protein
MYTLSFIINTDLFTSDYLGGQSESVTNYVITKTTSGYHDDDSEVEKKTRGPKRRKTTTKLTHVTTKLARSHVTLSISDLVENNECTFQGNQPDPDNCQCNYFEKILFYIS